MIHKKISVFTTRRYSKIIGNKVFIPIVLGIRTSFFSFKLDVTEIFFPDIRVFSQIDDNILSECLDLGAKVVNSQREVLERFDCKGTECRNKRQFLQ